MIVAVLVTSILLNVSYQYSYEKDYLSEFEEKDQALEKLQSGPDKAIGQWTIQRLPDMISTKRALM